MIQMGKKARWTTAFAITLAIFLAGCGEDGGDDLDRWMRDSGNGLQGKIEPLPEIVPYQPVAYNPDGALNDPFTPRKALGKEGGFRPENHVRQPLEAFPLESLKLVGTIFKDKTRVALIKTPDNTVQQVKIGNYLGLNYGVITEISSGPPSEVKLKEMVQDALTGDWAERPASIVQQD
jgi:type IV pilus assembly protein PilP